MTLSLIGVNHKTAPIALRERIAISREELPEVTRALAAVPGVSECMIVSTCIRVEILQQSSRRRSTCPGFLQSHFGLIPQFSKTTSTNTATSRRCGNLLAWRPVSIQWWLVSPRSWAR